VSRRSSTADVAVRVRPDRAVAVGERHYTAGERFTAPEELAAALLQAELVDLDEQLDEPVPGYERLPAATILRLLEDGPLKVAEAIVAYERTRERPRRNIHTFDLHDHPRHATVRELLEQIETDDPGAGRAPTRVPAEGA
jgi:hypothetical protein